jgi:hypothetical protein
MQKVLEVVVGFARRHPVWYFVIALGLLALGYLIGGGFGRFS